MLQQLSILFSSYYLLTLSDKKSLQKSKF